MEPTPMINTRCRRDMAQIPPWEIARRLQIPQAVGEFETQGSELGLNLFHGIFDLVDARAVTDEAGAHVNQLLGLFRRNGDRAPVFAGPPRRFGDVAKGL